MCSIQSMDVMRSVVGTFPASHDGNHALAKRYIDERVTPIVRLCSSAPSSRNRTVPGANDCEARGFALGRGAGSLLSAAAARMAA